MRCMSMELYHYLHCPYCIRIRLAWGYLGIKYKSIVLGYSDEATPMELTGKKMLPIARLNDGRLMNESIDIIVATDTNNQLAVKNFVGTERQIQVEDLLNSFSKPLFGLAMPFYALSGEFSLQDRAYFIKKKSLSRGPFDALLLKGDTFRDELVPFLKKIEGKVKHFFDSDHLRMEDILLVSHLWGLYMVPEFRFSEALNNYMQRTKDICKFQPWNDYANFLSVE